VQDIISSDRIARVAAELVAFRESQGASRAFSTLCRVRP